MIGDSFNTAQPIKDIVSVIPGKHLNTGRLGSGSSRRGSRRKSTANKEERARSSSHSRSRRSKRTKRSSPGTKVRSLRGESSRGALQLIPQPLVAEDTFESMQQRHLHHTNPSKYRTISPPQAIHMHPPLMPMMTYGVNQQQLSQYDNRMYRSNPMQTLNVASLDKFSRGNFENLNSIEYSNQNGQLNLNIGNTGFNLPPRQPLNTSPPININDSAAIEATYNHLVRETLGKTKKSKKSKKSSKHVRELSFQQQQKDIIPTRLPVRKAHARVTSSPSTNQNLDDFIARQQGNHSQSNSMALGSVPHSRVGSGGVVSTLQGPQYHQHVPSSSNDLLNSRYLEQNNTNTMTTTQGISKLSGEQHAMSRTAQMMVERSRSHDASCIEPLIYSANEIVVMPSTFANTGEPFMVDNQQQEATPLRDGDPMEYSRSSKIRSSSLKSNKIGYRQPLILPGQPRTTDQYFQVNGCRRPVDRGNEDLRSLSPQSRAQVGTGTCSEQHMLIDSKAQTLMPKDHILVSENLGHPVRDIHHAQDFQYDDPSQTEQSQYNEQQIHNHRCDDSSPSPVPRALSVKQAQIMKAERSLKKNKPLAQNFTELANSSGVHNESNDTGSPTKRLGVAQDSPRFSHNKDTMAHVSGEKENFMRTTQVHPERHRNAPLVRNSFYSQPVRSSNESLPKNSSSLWPEDQIFNTQDLIKMTSQRPAKVSDNTQSKQPISDSGTQSRDAPFRMESHAYGTMQLQQATGTGWGSSEFGGATATADYDNEVINQTAPKTAQPTETTTMNRNQRESDTFRGPSTHGGDAYHMLRNVDQQRTLTLSNNYNSDDGASSHLSQLCAPANTTGKIGLGAAGLKNNANRSSQQTIQIRRNYDTIRYLKRRLNQQRMKDFAYRLVLQHQLGQVRQNLAQLLPNRDDQFDGALNPFQLINELDTMSRQLLQQAFIHDKHGAHVDTTMLSNEAGALCPPQVSRGLSRLSEIESSFQVSKNYLANTIQALNNTTTMPIDEQLKRQREESELVIGDLRKQIRDMQSEMRIVEERAASSNLNGGEQETPHLTERNARAEDNKLSFSALPQVPSKEQAFSQLQPQATSITEEELSALKSELKVSSSKAQDFQYCYSQAQAQIQGLRQDLKNRMEELCEMTGKYEGARRQLQMAQSQVRYVETANESEKNALVAAREHEKQWREGYETLYAKYTRAKEELVTKEQAVDKERLDAEAKIKRVVRKAERAIRFFRDAAFQRGAIAPGTMTSRCGLGKSADGKENEAPERLYARTRRTDGQSSYQKRAGEFNIKAGRSVQPQTRPSRFRPDSHMTSDGGRWHCNDGNQKSEPALLSGRRQHHQTTKSPDSRYSQHSAVLSSRSQKIGTNLSNKQLANRQDAYSNGTRDARQRSHSPLHQTITTEDLTGVPQKSLRPLIGTVTTRGDGTQYDSEKLLLIATDALEACYEEMSGLKCSLNSLCEKHANKTCGTLQKFQVLSFDYLRKIDELLQREDDLRKQLVDKDKQAKQLAGLVKTSQAMIQCLVKQAHESQHLKQKQFGKIIKFDMVKMAEQKKLQATIKQEVQLACASLENLYGEMNARVRVLDHVKAEHEYEAKTRQAVENEMANFKEARRQLEDENNNMRHEKEECYFRLQKIETAIQNLVRKYTDRRNANEKELNAQPDLPTFDLRNQTTQMRHVYTKSHSLESFQQQRVASEPRSPCEQRRVRTLVPATELAKRSNTIVPKAPVDEPVTPPLGDDNSCLLAITWLQKLGQLIERQAKQIESNKAYFDGLQSLILDSQVGTSQNTQRRGGTNLGLNASPLFTEAGRHVEVRDESRMMGADYDRRRTGHVAAPSGLTEQLQMPMQPREVYSSNPTSISNEDLLHVDGRNLYIEQNNSQTNVMQTLSHSPRYLQTDKHESRRNFASRSEIHYENQRAGCDSQSLDSFIQTHPRPGQGTGGLTPPPIGTLRLTSGAPLHAQVQNLLGLLAMKDRELADQQGRMQEYNEDFLTQERTYQSQIDELNAVIRRQQEEQEQLQNLCQQENGMRQQLEESEAELRAGMETWETRQRQAEAELQEFVSKFDKVQDDQARTQQSLEYWENSFRVLEQHYVQEKERSDSLLTEMQKDQQSLQNQKEDLEIQIDKLVGELQPLRRFWEDMEKREYLHQVSQTQLTSDALQQTEEQLEKQVKEVAQTQKDIQVLLTSYDNYKDENMKKQNELKNQLAEALDLQKASEDLLNEKHGAVVARLNSQIQEAIGKRQRAEEEAQAAQNAKNTLERQLTEAQEKLAAFQLRSTIDLHQYNSLHSQTQPPSPAPHSQSGTGTQKLKNGTSTPNTQVTKAQVVPPSYRIGQFAAMNKFGGLMESYSYASSSQQQSLQRRIPYVATSNPEIMLSQATSHGNFDQHLGRASMTQSTLQKLLQANTPYGDYGMPTYDEQERHDKRQSQFSFLNEQEMQGADPAQAEQLRIYLEEQSRRIAEQQPRQPFIADQASAEQLVSAHGQKTITDDESAMVEEHPLDAACMLPLQYHHAPTHPGAPSNQELLSHCVSEAEELGNYYQMPQQYMTQQQRQVSIMPTRQPSKLDTIPGLDICQQCINYEAQIGVGQEQLSEMRSKVRCLLDQYLTLSRYLTEVCLDREGVLGDIDLNLRQSGVNSRNLASTESLIDESALLMNGEKDSQMSLKPSQRTQLVRKAFKFVNQECSDEDDVRLQKVHKFTWQIAQILTALAVKAEAAEKLNMPKQQSKQGRSLSGMQRLPPYQPTNLCDLSKSASLGIQDYSRCSGPQDGATVQASVVTASKGCQADLAVADSSSMALTKQAGLTRQPSRQSLIATSSEMAARVREVAAQMDQLGVSLDQKIDTFLQLLMSLKSLKKAHQASSKSSDESPALVRLVDSLVSTLSSVVHEMTEDTRVLGEVKMRVEELIGNDTCGADSSSYAPARAVNRATGSTMLAARPSDGLTSTHQQRRGNESHCLNLPLLLERAGETQQSAQRGDSLLERSSGTGCGLGVKDGNRTMARDSLRSGLKEIEEIRQLGRQLQQFEQQSSTNQSHVVVSKRVSQEHSAQPSERLKRTKSKSREQRGARGHQRRRDQQHREQDEDRTQEDELTPVVVNSFANVHQELKPLDKNSNEQHVYDDKQDETASHEENIYTDHYEPAREFTYTTSKNAHDGSQRTCKAPLLPAASSSHTGEQTVKMHAYMTMERRPDYSLQEDTRTSQNNMQRNIAENRLESGMLPSVCDGTISSQVMPRGVHLRTMHIVNDSHTPRSFLNQPSQTQELLGSYHHGTEQHTSQPNEMSRYGAIESMDSKKQRHDGPPSSSNHETSYAPEHFAMQRDHLQSQSNVMLQHDDSGAIAQQNLSQGTLPHATSNHVYHERSYNMPMSHRAIHTNETSYLGKNSGAVGHSYQPTPLRQSPTSSLLMIGSGEPGSQGMQNGPDGRDALVSEPGGVASVTGGSSHQQHSQNSKAFQTIQHPSHGGSFDARSGRYVITSDGPSHNAAVVAHDSRSPLLAITSNMSSGGYRRTPREEAYLNFKRDQANMMAENQGTVIQRQLSKGRCYDSSIYHQTDNGRRSRSGGSRHRSGSRSSAKDRPHFHQMNNTMSMPQNRTQVFPQGHSRQLSGGQMAFHPPSQGAVLRQNPSLPPH